MVDDTKDNLIVSASNTSHIVHSQESNPSAIPSSKGDHGKLIAITVVILFTVIPMAIAGFLYTRPVHPTNMDVNLTVDLRVESYSDGNWTIVVTHGSKPVSGVQLQVVNRTDGTLIIQKALDILTQSYNDPDVTYYDRNENSRLDTGDRLILKSSGGHIIAGYYFQLIRNESIIGSIRELPA